MKQLLQLCRILAAAFAFCASSAFAESVNVYTERQPAFLEAIFDQFTSETGIDVNVLYLDSGTVARLRSEGRNSPADVVIVADIGRLQGIARRDLVQPISSSVVERHIGPELRDPEGLWLALTRRLRLLYVARDSSEAPATYEELAQPRYHGEICLRSGSHPYNVALISAVISHHGENAARQWLEGVKSNLARSPQGNDRAQIKGVANGECGVAVANLYYYFKMLNSDDASEREAAAKVRWVAPTLAGEGVHVNVSGIAMAKNAPNPENALKLVEFMVGEKAQRIYAQDNYELPARPGIAMPPELADRAFEQVDKLPLADIAAQLAAASKLVEAVDFDG